MDCGFLRFMGIESFKLMMGFDLGGLQFEDTAQPPFIRNTFTVILRRQFLDVFKAEFHK